MYSAEEIYRVKDYLHSIISDMEHYKSIEDIHFRQRLADDMIGFMFFSVITPLLPEELKEEINRAHRLYIALTPYQGE